MTENFYWKKKKIKQYNVFKACRWDHVSGIPVLKGAHCQCPSWPDNALDLCNYLMACWSLKCFSRIAYMLAWVGWQRESPNIRATSGEPLCPSCVLCVAYWARWQRAAFHMASDRDEESGWLMGGRQRGFSPQRQVLKGEHRDIVAALLRSEREGWNPTPSVDPWRARGWG